MKAKLTVTLVESVAAGDKDIVVWDTELSGFGCKITPKGRRTYFLYYRTREGQQRRPAIGLHGALRPEGARQIARSWLADIAKGDDPSLSRKMSRTAPTVRDLCNRYVSDHAEIRKKASSTKGDQRLIALHVLPALGAKKVASVTRSDIAALHMALRATPYEANRTLALLSTMFRLAERWSMRADGSNPATNVSRFKEAKRERYLTTEEISRLWGVLAKEETEGTTSKAAIAAIRLLILTGRRLSEMLTLKWSYIDFDSKLLRLPDTKSGALQVALGDGTIAVLKALKADAALPSTEDAKPPPNPFVIVGRGKSPHLVNLQKPWRRIRKAAGLDDVRIHDLRHTFASIGAGLGMSYTLVSLLRTLPPSWSASDSPKGLMSFIDEIGYSMQARLLKGTFEPDYIGSFTVPSDAHESVVSAVGDALNAGALIYLPDEDGLAESALLGLRGRRFRLSYTLAPRYRIALTAGQAISLPALLSGRHGSAGMAHQRLLDLGSQQ